VPLRNQFLSPSVALEALSVAPRILVHQGQDFNATIGLQLSQPLVSPEQDRYVCWLSYTL